MGGDASVSIMLNVGTIIATLLSIYVSYKFVRGDQKERERTAFREIKLTTASVASTL